MLSHASPQKYSSLTTQNIINGGNIKSQTQHLNKTITYPANSSLISRNNQQQSYASGRNLVNPPINNSQLMQNGPQPPENYQNLHKHISDKLKLKQGGQVFQGVGDENPLPKSKTKIESKNRMAQETQYLQKNKNVTDAQKRIAKIIREQQQNGQQERSNSNPAPLSDPMKKKSSQQKSRNAAVQQSKSENNTASHSTNLVLNKNQQYSTSNFTNSPKTLLMQQQKKLIEQHSNANYLTANSNNLRNMANLQQQQQNQQNSEP